MSNPGLAVKTPHGITWIDDAAFINQIRLQNKLDADKEKYKYFNCMARASYKRRVN